VVSGVTFDPDTGLGFNGATPAAPPNYTSTTASTIRSISDGSGTGTVRSILGTLIKDLINMGILQ
jgi:hypothetical protein